MERAAEWKPSENIEPSRNTFIALLLILSLGAITYANSLTAPFLFDDVNAIPGNWTIRHLWPISPVLFGATYASVAGRPILNLSLATNYAVGGLDVTGYHLFNLAIHLLASIALFGVARRTFELISPFRKSSHQLATIIALIWLVHPLQTESVTYVIQRSEAMVGLFYLSTIYCLIRAAQPKVSRFWAVACVLVCALGMGTKEVMVSAPLIAFLFDWIFLAGSWRAALKARWRIHAGLCASWIVLAALMATSGQREGSAGFGLGMSAWDYARTQFGFIVMYLRLCYWPFPLVLDYGVETSRTVSQIAIPAAILLVLCATTLILLFRNPRLGFLGVAFFAILAPTSSFVPLAGQVAAEHRMYLPLAVVVAASVLLVHAGLQKLTGNATTTPDNRLARKRLPVFLSGAVVLFLAARTAVRNNDYQSPIRIWQGVVDHVPANPRGYNSLSGIYFDRGDLDASIRMSTKAIELQPAYSSAYFNRATALMHLNQFEDAIRDFTQSISINPREIDAYINRGSTYQMSGQPELAVQDYASAIALQPENPKPYYDRGAVQQQQGQLDAAMADYNEAINRDANYADAYNNRGLLLQAAGNAEFALRDFSKAISLNPSSAPAYANRGAAFLKLGQIDAAIRDCNNAITLDPKLPTAYVCRAIGYFRLKQYPNAWADVRKAQEMSAQIDARFLRDLQAAAPQAN